jgi:hypothetical protein
MQIQRLFKAEKPNHMESGRRHYEKYKLPSKQGKKENVVSLLLSLSTPTLLVLWSRIYFSCSQTLGNR